jgi:hypothetical protein
MKRTILSIAMIAMAAGAARAQSAEFLSLEPGQQAGAEKKVAGQNKLKGFTFGLRVESWRAELEVEDTDPPGLEGALDEPTVIHNALLAFVSYDLDLAQNATLTLFGGVGPEEISTRLDVGPTSMDSSFDEHLVFEVGAQIGIQIDRLDIGGGLSIRSGTEADVEASDSEELTYFYYLFRLKVEAGYRIIDPLRVFGGVRASFYGAEWENDDQSMDFEAEFDMPFGLFLGAELNSGPMSARLEASVLDAFGFMLSVGWTF